MNVRRATQRPHPAQRRRRLPRRSTLPAPALLAALWSASLSACASDPDPADLPVDPPAAHTAGAPAPASMAAPVLEPSFQHAYRDGDLYLAGAPQGAESFLAAKALGVTTVVDLITDEERAARVSFDEGAALADLGMRHVRIPLTPDSFTAAHVDAFDQVMQQEGAGRILVHCASANRAAGLYAAWLAQAGMPVDAAIERGKALGLHSAPMIEAVRRVAGP